MTVQISEVMIYNGEEYQLVGVPLEPYLLKHNIIFEARNSGCWRGYIGHWLIEDSCLYLTNLSANIANNNSGWGSEKVGIDYLFPGQNKVFAEWFSGKLRLPYGRRIPHAIFVIDYFYEKELVFEFVNGKCVSSHEIDNVKLYEERRKLAEKRRLEKGI